MHILITAGNTQTPIDRVRCMTNIFSGRTGTAIALHCQRQGRSVTLLTSHPELVDRLKTSDQSLTDGWRLVRYRTFDDLHKVLRKEITQGSPDVVIHSAAVSDYRSEGVYSPAEGTTFDDATAEWQTVSNDPPTLEKTAGGKIKSNADELWIRLVRTPKLIDKMRAEWGFRGLLVKFKLEVGIDDQQLLRIAENARQQSDAHLMVANSFEDYGKYAWLGPVRGEYQRIARGDLPARLLDEIAFLTELSDKTKK